MELKGSKTEKNLWEAFAGESQARNKYTYFASKAKKEGYEQISAIFNETANNEKEHAKIWFKLLMENGQIPDTLTCLKMAAAGENEEHTSMYPRMAAEAKEEGFDEISALFTMVATIEKEHEERYKALAANIEAGKVFARETEQVWRREAAAPLFCLPGEGAWRARQNPATAGVVLAFAAQGPIACRGGVYAARGTSRQPGTWRARQDPAAVRRSLFAKKFLPPC